MPSIRALTIIALISYSLGVVAYRGDIPRSRSLPAVRRRVQQRPQYDPVPAYELRDYEVRDGHGHAPISDYIMRSMTNTVHMVERHYGLRNSESFYWGLGGKPLANLTAYANGKDVKVLSMERFGGVLDAAHCSHDSVKFMFNNEVQFDNIQKAWAWVNSAESNYIVLITENAQCNMPDGDPSVRQPWHVKHASFDDSNNAVTLSAEPKSWKDAFSDLHLRVKSRGIVPGQQPQHRPLDKRFTIEGDPTIPLAMTIPSTPLVLTSDDDDDNDNPASIACDPCFTTGSLDFDIDVVPWLIPPHLSGTISVIGNDIGASITAKATIPATIINGAGASDTIFTWAPPSLGFSIADIIDVGPTLNFNIFANVGQIESDVEISTGVNITIPNDSIYKVDFDDSTRDEDYGWIPQFTPLPPTMSESLSISASVGAEVQLVIEATVLGIGAGAGFQLVAPTLDIEANGTVGADACGVAGADVGVELNVELGAALDAFEFALGATATQTIAATSIDLFSTCITIASGPVSSAVVTSSAATTSFALTASSAVTTSSTATATSSFAVLTSSAFVASSAVPPYPMPGNSTIPAR